MKRPFTKNEMRTVGFSVKAGSQLRNEDIFFMGTHQMALYSHVDPTDDDLDCVWGRGHSSGQRGKTCMERRESAEWMVGWSWLVEIGTLRIYVSSFLLCSLFQSSVD